MFKNPENARNPLKAFELRGETDKTRGKQKPINIRCINLIASITLGTWQKLLTEN